MKTNLKNATTRRRAQLFLALLGLLLLSNASTSAQAQLAGQLGGELQWQTNIEQAKAIAKRENKLVLLHFGASWCRPCKSLDVYVFNSKSVKNAIAENVVPVKLDADRDIDAVNEFDVQMVPYDVIITSEGRIISQRRSPADAENYARMINGFSSASRKLGATTEGAIAHQRNAIANNFVGKSTDFAPEAPTHEHFGLSKDSSLLQRRQSAFNNAANGTSTSTTQSNPWVVPKTDVDASMTSTSKTQSTARLDDLERNSFLQRQRYLASESSVTRRAKPKRIMNERYFDAVAKRDADAAAEQLAAAEPTDDAEVTSTRTEEENVSSFKLPPAAGSMLVLDDPGFTIEASEAEVIEATSISADEERQENSFYAIDDSSDSPAFEAAVNDTNEADSFSFEPTESNSVEVAVADADEKNNDVAELQLNTFDVELDDSRDLNSATITSLEPAAQNSFAAVTEAAVKPATEVDRKQFCLYGKCPVTLIQEGRWVDGDIRFGIVHRNRTYLFGSAEKLALFQASPDGLSPVLAGYDPVLYHEQGRLVDGLAENGVFMGTMPQQSVVLFESAETRAKFQAQPTMYLNTIREAMNKMAGQNIVR